MDQRKIDDQPFAATAGYAASKTKSRLDWVDCAKGFCIIMVVMLHSTLSVEEAVGSQGFMEYLVAFSKPFRMPDFFLISGLFLAKVIHREWQTYLDRKVLHFFYFYVMWVTIHFAIKSPGIVLDHGFAFTVYLYLETFIQPFGTLWFIYLLPILFVVTKLIRKVHPVLIFAIAAVLEIAVIETGVVIVDQFASRFVYFYSGYWLAKHIFNFAAAVQRRPLIATVGLILWAFVNGVIVFQGYSQLPGISLVLGFIGAAAIITIAALLMRTVIAKPVHYCGKNSIVIYLAFFLPMHTALQILTNTGLIPDAGWMALCVTTAGIVGALIIWRMVRNTRLYFLFSRPALLKFDRSPSIAVSNTFVSEPMQLNHETIPEIVPAMKG